MTARIRRWASFVAVAAMVAACSAPGGDSGSEAEPTRLPTPPADDDTTQFGSDREPRPTASAAVGVIDEECYDDAVRCGQILVPQVPGSLDQVSMQFEEYGAPDDRPSVLVLNSSRYPSLPDPGVLAGRHVVAIETRGVWPAQPAPTCDEWWYLEADAPEAALRAATTACHTRLENSGIDLSGNSRENRAADITQALATLEILESVDIIAVGGRADVVAALPASVVGRVVYVQPWFSGSDPTITRVRDLVASVEAVWDVCAESAGCTLRGTVDDFWNDIAELDDAPISRPPSEFGEPPPPINSGSIIAAVSSAAYTANDAAYFPAVHAAIQDRDVLALDAFTQNSSGSTEITGYAIACARSTAEPDDFDAFPDPVREYAVTTLESFQTLCDVLHPGVAETVLDSPPGLSLLTLSDGWRSVGSDTVIEPTVGAPTTECILRAATAYFDGEVNRDGCTLPLSFTSRDTEIHLTSTSVELGDHVASILVPESWGDGEYGYWERNADLTDSAALDLYVWLADSPTAALDEMMIDWGLIGPDDISDQSARLIGDRMVHLASVVNPWNESTTVIAVALVDGENLAAVLDGPTAEIESLIDSVLVPLFTDASVAPVES